MSDYLDLHKLQETGTDYTVERVIDDTLQSSPECQLPSNIPLVISLPVLDITLPDLDCNFNVDIPLTPLPFYCSPSVTGGINVTTCDGGAITIDENSLAFNRINECDFEIGGELKLCVGDICPTVENDVSITIIGEYLTGSGTLSIEQLTDPCKIKLTGNIDIESTLTTIACIDGMDSDHAAATISVGEHLESSGSITLTKSGCIFGLVSDLDISLTGGYCLDGPTAGGGGTITVDGDPLSVTGTLEISTDPESCTIDLVSDVNISFDCSKIGTTIASGLSTEFDVTVTTGSETSKANLGMYNVDSGCKTELRGNPYINIYLPMEEYEVTICNGESEETITIYKKVG
jgi:hypothetical protein